MPLPTTVNDEPVWVTDIHVYPKNGVSAIEKIVDDSNAYVLGDLVQWDASVRVPGMYGTEALTSFSITDTLDSRLGYVAGSLDVTLTSADGSTTNTLIESTHYTLTHTGAGADGEGGTLTVVMTADGLTALMGAAKGTVTVTFDTQVLAVGDDGIIMNTAFANINDNEIGSEPADTRWGAVRIFKHDKDDPTMGLEGAAFQVYLTETGGTPLSPTDFTTGADGTVLIPGLKAGVTYWLEETQAPDRYLGLTTRIEVTGLEAGHTVQVPLEVKVPNTLLPPWQLPLTGGTGLLIPFVGAGMLLIAVGAALTFRRVRR